MIEGRRFRFVAVPASAVIPLMLRQAYSAQRDHVRFPPFGSALVAISIPLPALARNMSKLEGRVTNRTYDRAHSFLQKVSCRPCGSMITEAPLSPEIVRINFGVPLSLYLRAARSLHPGASAWLRASSRSHSGKPPVASCFASENRSRTTLGWSWARLRAKGSAAARS